MTMKIQFDVWERGDEKETRWSTSVELLDFLSSWLMRLLSISFLCFCSFKVADCIDTTSTWRCKENTLEFVKVLVMTKTLPYCSVWYLQKKNISFGVVIPPSHRFFFCLYQFIFSFIIENENPIEKKRRVEWKVKGRFSTWFQVQTKLSYQDQIEYIAVPVCR